MLAVIAAAAPEPWIDTTISLGNLLTILAFILGGIGFVYTLRSDLKVVATTTDLRFTQISADIIDFKEDIKRLNEVITKQVAQDARISAQDERLTSAMASMNHTAQMTGQRLDDVSSRLNRFVDSKLFEKEIGRNG